MAAVSVKRSIPLSLLMLLSVSLTPREPVPARVSVTVKNDLVPELIMSRLIVMSRNGLKFKFVKAVCPYRTHFPISGKTSPISTPEIFMACYCVARN